MVASSGNLKDLQIASMIILSIFGLHRVSEIYCMTGMITRDTTSRGYWVEYSGLSKTKGAIRKYLIPLQMSHEEIAVQPARILTRYIEVLRKSLGDDYDSLLFFTTRGEF